MELKDATTVLAALVNEDWDVFNEFVPVEYWNAVLPENDSLGIRCRAESATRLAVDLMVSGKRHSRTRFELMLLMKEMVDANGDDPAQMVRELRNLAASINGLANRIEGD